MNKAIASRFWKKVDKTNNCWNWLAHINNWGYGQFWDGENQMKAHRMSWVISHGDIPDGMCILHRCDNPKCVNPNHLFLGTLKDNMIDMVNKGRNVTHMGKGEDNPSAKLTEIEVRIIRAYHPALGSRQLSNMFGIAMQNIWKIVTYRSWKHI